MHKGQRKYTVKRSAAGLGLYATEPIKQGEFIIEYIGERITAQEAAQRKTRYLFEIDERHTIDGATRKNIARYVNHFCNPNVEAEIEDGEIHLSALRDIKAGEELGFDYGEEYFNEFIKPYGCKCPSCRKKKEKTA